jgi:hypothetical protein
MFSIVLDSDMLHQKSIIKKIDMDIMRSQGNMTWINMTHHRITCF